MAEQEGIESGRDRSFEPRGLEGLTLEQQIEKERAELAAAEKAAAQQAPQADAQPAATTVEPAQPLRYEVDRGGNVLTAADTTGKFAASAADLNQTNGSR